MNPWFRLYSEFANDPKVQMMSETYQRRLIMLFCFRCNGHITLQNNEVTFQLRISENEWAETKAIFIAKGFIDSDNNLLNWDKRQFRSDSSAERVRKHRESKKQPYVTECNVTVTPQNRTDTDTEKKESKRQTVSKHNDQDFEIFWKDFPKQRSGSKQKAHSAWLNALTRTTKEKIYESVKSYASSDEVARGFAKGAAAWLADDRWESDYSIVARTGSGAAGRNSGNGGNQDALPGDRKSSKWLAEGDRLAEKYQRDEAIRQGIAGENAGEGLRLATAIRQD